MHYHGKKMPLAKILSNFIAFMIIYACLHYPRYRTNFQLIVKLSDALRGNAFHAFAFKCWHEFYFAIFLFRSWNAIEQLHSSPIFKMLLLHDDEFRCARLCQCHSAFFLLTIQSPPGKSSDLQSLLIFSSSSRFSSLCSF